LTLGLKQKLSLELEQEHS